MERMYLREIIEATGGRLLQGDPNHPVSGVGIDSRIIKPGELFISLKGKRFDGHQFIPEVLEKGVRAFITEQEGCCPEGAHVILVEDTSKALKDLASYYRRKFDIPIIAVTGSTGKTTTKDMIHSVLSTRFKVLKTEGNYNNEVGLPLTIFNLSPEHQIAVLEMGMSGFGEIKRLVEIAEPCVGVITNIGLSHIEKLGSRENILKAKLEIFSRFRPEYLGILNGDNDLLKSIRGTLPFQVEYFGLSDENDLVAYDIVHKGERGLSYKMKIGDESHSIDLQVPGKHNVYNSLAAIAVGRHFGLSMEQIRNGLYAFQSGKMRMHIIHTGDGFTIIDDVYNASPDSMKAALATLRDFPGKRRIAVLGDMLELGEYAEEGHREVGRAVVDNGIDVLITKGEASRFIGRQAMELGMSKEAVFHFETNDDVIKMLEIFVSRNDTILVKGSRGMKMEEVVSFLQERRG